MVSLSFFYRFCLLSIGFMSATAVAGQKIALVYFQSETNLPFTITWNSQSYESDPKGGLAIKDIPLGEQCFQIDFGKDHGTASRFELRLSEDSRAFTIRQLLNNQLQLFNLVTYGLTTGTSLPVIKQVLVYQNPLASYSGAGQKDKNDSDNKQKELKDNKPNTSIVITGLHPEMAAPPIPTEVKKVFDQTGSDGIDQIYLLTGEGKTDTIALFIPVLKIPVSKTGAKPGSNEGMNPPKQQEPLPQAGKNQQMYTPQPLY